jgi:WD40 repeat protein/serine/threonine protein kinase
MAMHSNGRSVETIFAQAIEIESATERVAFLEEACGPEGELRQEVEKLVRDYFRAGAFMERPVATLVAALDLPLSERPGTAIGPYKLMEQIGEGGMGLVFVADQQQPLRRKVALKVIKPGMDSRAVIARFEAERQVLALMDHPNIAKVHDGGTTPAGRPYFVMELVKGVPITEYCDQNQVPIRNRLELFVDVCQAVQHAHQKGIIHRDLKPSNVLVVSHDGRPVVKVIDFGVAKAIGSPLTDKTVYTQFAQLIGTPLYMSPEQAGESGLDVDTRSDIYTLGVLLYELLTGTTPFDKERLKKASYDEMRRILREEEPPRPSTRLSTLGQIATTISTQRRSDPKQLRQLCRGELDWIVMKALEKDRNRRYETAAGLGRDIGRLLHDEPVHACPPSAAYRFRKFARRNKGVLAAVTLLTTALVVTTLVLAVSYVLVAGERNLKAQALEDRETALGQERAAGKEAERSLYVRTLTAVQSERATGNVGRAEQLLDEACPEKLRGWEWHYLKRLRYGARRPLQHSSCMCDLALSPDGRLLAAGGSDGIMKIWDTQRWEEIHSLQAHSGHIHRVAFGTGGRYVATAAWDGTAKVWDVATGTRIWTLQHDREEVSGLAFSPEGRWIASSDEGAVRIWDATTGRPVTTLPLAAGCLAFSPDGRFLAASQGQTVCLWETASWKKHFVLEPHTAGANGLAFRPDGAQLAAACGQDFWTGGAGEVIIWDVATGQLVHRLLGHVSGAFAVAFSPDGQCLASGGVEDGLIKLWDVQAGRETLTLRGHVDSVWGLAFSPDGAVLYSASHDHTVRAWDATTLESGNGPELHTLRGHTGPVTSVAFSPDKRHLASGSADRTIKVWDALTGQEVCTLTGHTGPIRGVAFRPDGRQLASVSLPGEGPVPTAGEVKLWDTKTWRELPGPMVRDDDNHFLLGVAFHPDGRRLAVVHGEGVVVWDTAAWARIRELEVPHAFCQTCVAFSPGSQLASAAVDGSIQIWELPAAEDVGAFAALVAPPGLDRLPDIWRATTSRLPAHLLEAHEGRAMSMAFRPDGAMLVSASMDGTIKFWDARTLAPVEEPLRGHQGGVNSLAFRPDGKQLASAGSDAVIRVWDTATRREVLELRGHTDAIYTVAFSPDGRLLASGSWDGTVRI